MAVKQSWINWEKAIAVIAILAGVFTAGKLYGESGFTLKETLNYCVSLSERSDVNRLDFIKSCMLSLGGFEPDASEFLRKFHPACNGNYQSYFISDCWVNQLSDADIDR